MDDFDAAVDGVLSPGAPKPAIDPYDAAVDNVIGLDKARTSGAIRSAITVNPEQAAKARGISARTGVPQDVVLRNLPEMEQKDVAARISAVSQKSQVLSGLFRDNRGFGQIAHDDVDNLSAIERIVKGRAQQASAPIDVFRTGKAYGGALAEGVIGTGAGGTFSGVAELGDIQKRAVRGGLRAIGLESIAAGMEEADARIPAWLRDPGGALMRTIGGAAKEAGEALGPAKEDRTFGTDVAGGIGQLGFQIATSILTGGTAAIPMLAAQGADSMTQKVANDEAAQAEKDIAVLLGAGWTAVTEKYGLDKILNRVPPAVKNAALRKVADIAAGAGIEAAQEAAEALGQDVIRRVFTDPNAEIGEGILNEAGVAGAVGGIVRAALGIRMRGTQAQQAKDAAASMEELDKMAEASKVRQRSPEDWQAFMQAVSEDGPVKDVYIDARDLDEAALAKLVEVSPAAAQQAAESLASGVDMQITAAEFGANVAGQGFAQSIIPHLKTDPNGMSVTQADEYLKTAKDDTERTVTETLGRAGQDDAFATSRAAVEADVLRQLNATGRFTETVNKPKAALWAARYATLGARLGITPEEAYRQYPATITAAPPPGEALERDATPSERSALSAFANADEMFSLPKSEATTVEQIAADNNPAIKVRKTELPGSETMWTLKMPDGRDAIITARKPGKYGPSVYSNDFNEKTQSYDPNTTRPGENAESLPPETEDLWIDVSRLKEGGAGATVYNIAATLAHNTGRVFIGDPSGISEQAMRRRPEHMLSSALKFGTTRHIAPHPDQVRGKYGTPPLKWAYGDDVGNVRNLIDLVLQIQKDVGNEGRYEFDFEVGGFRDAAGQPVGFDADTGRFADAESGGLDAGAVSPAAGAGSARQGNAGDRTLARNALLRAVLRQASGEGKGAVGDGSAVLARLVRVASESPAPVFYQADQPVGASGPQRPQVRGLFTPSAHNVALLEQANLTTFVHESGHLFLDQTAEIAARADAPADIKADMQTLLDWFGIKAEEEASQLEVWQRMTIEQQREHHEKFARGFEAFAWEGKAPSTALAGAFQRFRGWLRKWYQSLAGLNVQLTDEVRSVMSRMVATDVEIEQARAAQSMGLMFDQAAAEKLGIDYRAYQEQDRDATDEAATELDKRRLNDLKWFDNAKSAALRALQRQARELRIATQAEVTAEVDAMPAERARQALAQLPADLEPGTLDVVAEQFGYASGETMLQEVQALPKRGDLIRAMTDQRMLQNYGDITSPQEMERAAIEAVHNQARARVIATELNALEKAAKTSKRTVTTAAKAFAAQVVGRQKVGDLKPEKFEAAARKAGQASLKAFKAGDIQKAATEKRNELINTYAARIARDAKADIDKKVKTYTKAANKPIADVAKTRDADTVQAMRAILAEYGIGRRGEPAQKYIDALKAHDPDTHARLSETIDVLTANAKDYKALSVDDFQALADDVDQMWQMARRSRQMEIDGDMIDAQEAQEAVRAQLEKEGVPTRIAGEGHAVTEGEKTTAILRSARAALRRVESWTYARDGGPQGAFRKYVFNPIKVGADNYRAAQAKYRKHYLDLLSTLDLKGGRIDAPELGYVFGYSKGGSGKQEILHAILHTGNESNKRKLLLAPRDQSGRTWGSERADGTLDTTDWDAFIKRMIDQGVITKADYDFAQGVWDLLEETKAGAQKTHRQVFGRSFDEVTANSFVTPFGTYRGGYVPAMADPDAVSDAKTRAILEEENQTMAQAFPSTAKGFTKGRTEYNKALLLDLRSLAGHLDKVLMFTHLEAPVRDVRRLLGHESVRAPLSRMDSSAYDGMLIPWLNRAARQQTETPVPAYNGVMKWLSKARSRAGMSSMIGNVVNAAQQVTGFAVAAIRVKPRYLRSAMVEYAKNPRKLTQHVSEASQYMEARMRNEVAQMNLAIDDILLNPNVHQKAQAWTARHGYFLQSAVDNVMGPIIWTGAYNEAIEQGASEVDARRQADSAIRETQGSTLPEDIAAFEAGNAFTRLFTQFQGYFNMQANLLGTEFAKTQRDMGLRAGMGRGLYVFTLGFLAPALVGQIIAELGKGGPDDEDGDGYLDDWLASLGIGAAKSAFALVPGAGQAGVLVFNAANNKPYDDRASLSPAVSMVEAAARSPFSVYAAIAGEGSARKAVRDVGSLISLTTGLPGGAVARPLGYAADLATERIEPTSPVDLARGLVTGNPSAESRQ